MIFIARAQTRVKIIVPKNMDVLIHLSGATIFFDYDLGPARKHVLPIATMFPNVNIMAKVSVLPLKKAMNDANERNHPNSELNNGVTYSSTNTKPVESFLITHFGTKVVKSLI